MFQLKVFSSSSIYEVCYAGMLIAPLREINLPPNRPFNKLSNGVGLLHMQIDAAASEMQRLKHSAVATGCTEIVVK